MSRRPSCARSGGVWLTRGSARPRSSPARPERRAGGGRPDARGGRGRRVRERTDVELLRPVLARVHRVSNGNPFSALQMARALAREGSRPEPGRPLPVPEDLHGCSEPSSRRSRPQRGGRCSPRRCVSTYARARRRLRGSARPSGRGPQRGAGRRDHRERRRADTLSRIRSSRRPSTRARGRTNGETSIAGLPASSLIPRSERGISRWPRSGRTPTRRGPSRSSPLRPARGARRRCGARGARQAIHHPTTWTPCDGGASSRPSITSTPATPLERRIY